MILPYHLRPLRWNPRQEERKPHESELCQRCKELGRNCREFQSEDTSDDVRVTVMPHDLQPLHWNPCQEEYEPHDHESELRCQRCQELGHNCTELDSNDTSDNVSIDSGIATTCSSIVTSSDEEEMLTPAVPSDTEITNILEELNHATKARSS